MTSVTARQPNMGTDAKHVQHVNCLSMLPLNLQAWLTLSAAFQNCQRADSRHLSIFVTAKHLFHLGSL